jgi:hypothetical protein
MESGNWDPKTKERIQHFWATEYKNKMAKKSDAQPEV